MKTIYLLCIILTILSYNLMADEISDTERQLRETEAQVEQRRRQEQEAARRLREEEQRKIQTQRQLTQAQNQIINLRRKEQEELQNIEQARNIISQTQQKIEQINSNTNQTILHLLIADQAKTKLKINTPDTQLLTNIAKNHIAQRNSLHYQIVNITTDTTNRERELDKTIEEATAEQERIDTYQRETQQIDTTISTLERQRREYQDQANQLARTATELQTLINTLREQAERYQHTYAFPNGVEAPVRGRIITPFGTRTDPRYNIQTYSNGIDIAVPENTPVRAIADGVVVFSGNFSTLGRMIVIDHQNGIHSLYAFNNLLIARKDENVTKGQTIAQSGKRNTEQQPSLHFEIRRGGTAVNPLDYVRIQN